MGRFRDAITGLFTTKAHAAANPETTVEETVGREPERGLRVTVRIEMACGCFFGQSVTADPPVYNANEVAGFIENAASKIKHAAVVRFKDHRCPRNGL